MTEYTPKLLEMLNEGSDFAKALYDELVSPSFGFPPSLLQDKLATSDSSSESAVVSSCGFDHICYRVATTEAYEQWKEVFTAHPSIKLLKENIIGGRPIAVYKLPHPFISKKNASASLFSAEQGRDEYFPTFQVIELPSPKASSPYTEGWEHGECPVASTPFATMEGVMEAFPQHKAKWDFNGYKKDSNADIALKLPSGRSVKFHLESLEDVIEREA